MHENFILLKGCSIGYITGENVKQVCTTHVKLLPQLIGAFLCLRQVDPTCQRIIEAVYFVDASTKAWFNLVLSVTPKAYIFEVCAIYSMQTLNSLGDKT